MKMIDDIMEMLESGRATLLSGIFLAIGLLGPLCGVTSLGAALWGCMTLSGLPLFYGALKSLLNEHRINTALLVSIGMSAAIAVGEQAAAAEIALIMAVGELLEHGTVRRARRGMERLVRLSPSSARRLDGQGESMVPLDQLRLGDTLRVRPGEMIPADGEVVAGRGCVDQSMITGESLPTEKGVGSSVYAGSINSEGSLDIRITHTPQDSSLQRLIRLVEEAGQRQAPMQREVDRWARWLVPASLLLALGGFAVLRLLGYNMDDALLRAVTVLVTFCPCGLVLATPTCIMAAIGQATGKGVVIKGGEALEMLGKVNTLAFDKTGTLTLGRPQVSAVQCFGSTTEDTLLRTAAAVEQRSEHLLARAVVSEVEQRKLPLPEAQDFRSYAGRGVEATVSGQRVRCMAATTLQQEGFALSPAEQAVLDSYRREGLATVLVVVDGALAGIIALRDLPRPESAAVLGELASYQRILLTGDHPQAAARLAQDLALDEIHAGLLPADKANIIRQLRDAGKCVAMLGDGVNDAPALKTADVGISMSHLGSDLATEAADIALMQDDLTRLPYLLRLARATLHSIRLNITLALLINLIAVTLGLLGVLTPLTGALMHNIGSLIVIFNAALLYERNFLGAEAK